MNPTELPQVELDELVGLFFPQSPANVGVFHQADVAEMPADANQWMPNIKRWAGQVGLDQLTDQQLTTRTSEIKVDEVAGKLVDLAADSEAEQGVIAAMVKRKGSAWFFKLSGDRGLVDQSREEFEAFMETVRYQ